MSLGNTILQIPPYTLGHMTDTVYPLNGAYEDWAYAAGIQITVSKYNKRLGKRVSYG
jgi:hypothetical protein